MATQPEQPPAHDTAYYSQLATKIFTVFDQFRNRARVFISLMVISALIMYLGLLAVAIYASNRWPSAALVAFGVCALLGASQGLFALWFPGLLSYFARRLLDDPRATIEAIANNSDFDRVFSQDDVDAADAIAYWLRRLLDPALDAYLFWRAIASATVGLVVFVVSASQFFRFFSISQGGFSVRGGDFWAWIGYATSWLLNGLTANAGQVFNWWSSGPTAATPVTRGLMWAFNVVLSSIVISALVRAVLWLSVFRRFQRTPEVRKVWYLYRKWHSRSVDRSAVARELAAIPPGHLARFPLAHPIHSRDNQFAP